MVGISASKSLLLPRLGFLSSRKIRRAAACLANVSFSRGLCVQRRTPTAPKRVAHIDNDNGACPLCHTEASYLFLLSWRKNVFSPKSLSAQFTCVCHWLENHLKKDSWVRHHQTVRFSESGNYRRHRNFFCLQTHNALRKDHLHTRDTGANGERGEDDNKQPPGVQDTYRYRLDR